MMTILRVHLLCLCWHLLQARETFLFLNTIHSEVAVHWLQSGASDPGAGIFMQHVPASGYLKSGENTIQTSKGHAFCFALGGHRSQAIVHDGDDWNVAVVRKGANSALEVESIGGKALRKLVRGSSGKARTPQMGIQLPEDFVRKASQLYLSQSSKPPEVLSQKKTCDGSGPAGSERHNEIVLLSELEFPLSIRWMKSAEDLDGVDKKKDPSQAVAKVKAASSAACFTRIEAQPNQLFYVVSPKLETGRRESHIFSYPGEFALVAVALDKTSADSLRLEILNEDDVKLFMNKVAMTCGHLSEDERKFQACFQEKAILPESGLLLPSSVSYKWFKRLWGALDSWRLCSYQSATTPVEYLQFSATTSSGAQRKLQADVLRKDPLVVAVHNVLSAEECQQLSDTVQTEELLRAYISGGRQSKDRRTLSKNMYSDLNDNSSVLTRATYRFFEIARQASGYKLYPPGQEPVNWLFYKPGYEYRAHCDGGCGSMKVARGHRVATSLVYCKVADEGGGTVFSEPPTLKLQPSTGMMLFFTYNSDPEAASRHAACPVLRGEKTTATQWYREGLTNDFTWERVDNGESPPEDDERKEL